MTHFLSIMWEFVRRDAKIAMSYRLQFFLHFAGLLSVSVTFFFLSLILRQVEGGIESLGEYGGSYFAFAIIGLAIIGLAIATYVDTSLRTFSYAIRSAQMTGTFEAMLTTKTRIGAVVAGSALYTLLYGMVRAVMLVGLGALLFGIELHGSGWPAVLVVFALTIVSTMALGIFAAGFIVLFKQGDPLTNAISGLTWLLSGVLYPKEILPDWVQQFAALLPVTHALEATRLALLIGTPIDDLTGSIVGLAIFAGAGVPVSLIWFGWAVGRARVAGSLARY